MASLSSLAFEKTLAFTVTWRLETAGCLRKKKKKNVHARPVLPACNLRKNRQLMWHRGGEAFQILNARRAVVTLFDNADVMAAEARRKGQKRSASDLFIRSLLHNEWFRAEETQSFRDPLAGMDAWLEFCLFSCSQTPQWSMTPQRARSNEDMWFSLATLW